MDGRFSGILKHLVHSIEQMTMEPDTLGKYAYGQVREDLGRYEKAVTEHGTQERDWGEFEVKEIRHTCARLEEGQRTENRAEYLTYIRNMAPRLLRKARKLDHDV